MTDNQSGAVSLSALEREHLATGYAIERAASDLPDGWSIRIDLEAGAGSVCAVDPQGREFDIDSGDLFSEQINEAVDVAKENWWRVTS